MNHFAPSIDAAREALGGDVTIVKGSLPTGMKGAKFSLEEVAKRVREGRIDPRVIGWAGQVLMKAGKPRDMRNQAQAILDALREKTIYTPDPVGAERITGAKYTLCLDELGLCLPAADCFPKGTQLLVRNEGLMPIESVKVGDQIWGFDRWTRVEASVSKGVLSITAIKLKNGGVLRLTEDHHVFLHERPQLKDRVRVRELSVGQSLLPPGARCTRVCDHWAEDHPDLGGDRTEWTRIVAIDRETDRLPCWDIQTEDHYVYLPEHDVTVSNCDDLSVALGSALMAVGIPVQVVAQCFDSSNIPSHVLVAAETSPNNWERLDPSSSKFKVGEYFPATKEWWFDPMKEIRMDDAGRPIGDFVGIGKVPYGFGQYQNVLLQIPNTPSLSEDQKAVIFDATTSQLSAAVNGLDAAVTGLEIALKQINQTRAALRPNTPFDPEANPPVTKVSDFPSGGVWTKNMNEIAWWLVGVGKKFVTAGRDALGGTRRIFIDQKTQDAYVEGKDADTFRLNTIRKVGDVVLAFINPAGAIITGLTASDGKVLTKEETEQELLAARSGGLSGHRGLGNPVVVVVAIVAGVVIMSLAAMYIIKEWCRSAEVRANEAVNLEVIKAVNAKTMTPEQAQSILGTLNRNRVTEAEARAKEAAASDPFTSLVKALGYVAVGGVVVGGAYLLHPIVKSAAENWSAKHGRRT